MQKAALTEGKAQRMRLAGTEDRGNQMEHDEPRDHHDNIALIWFLGQTWS